MRMYAGVDVGSSCTKAVVLDNNEVLQGYGVVRSGADFAGAAREAFDIALDMAGIQEKNISAVFSTGYGRNNVDFAQEARTEIACHAKGCYAFLPEALCVIDIGGQDNKIIKLGENGRRLGFQMNRKCAAGTGAFLEEMAARLDIPLSEMNALAMEATEEVTLGSFCTVFSGTEVLEYIRQGKKLSDIVKGIFLSMIRRVLEMDVLEGHVVMTGGVVAHNPYLTVLAGDIIGQKIQVPDHPQITGALGAALYAREIAARQTFMDH